MLRPCPRLGCAQINLRSISVDTCKLTAAGETSATKYDLSLHNLADQYYITQNSHNAKLENSKFFSDAQARDLQFFCT